MATLKDLKPTSRAFVEKYKFADMGPPALTRLPKNLAQCKVMLVTTAGLHLKTDKPFSRDFRVSDCSYRELPAWARAQDLTVTHTSGDFDRRGIEADLNVVYPIDRLVELQNEGVIGSVAKIHYSFMGSLLKVDDLKSKTAPELAQLAVKNEVDVVLLTPV